MALKALLYGITYNITTIPIIASVVGNVWKNGVLIEDFATPTPLPIGCETEVTADDIGGLLVTANLKITNRLKANFKIAFTAITGKDSSNMTIESVNGIGI